MHMTVPMHTSRFRAGFTAVIGLLICSAGQWCGSVAYGEAKFDSSIKPLLTKYCIDCHGGKKVKGKVDFTKITTAADIEKRFELWENVVDVLKHN